MGVVESLIETLFSIISSVFLLNIPMNTTDRMARMTLWQENFSQSLFEEDIPGTAPSETRAAKGTGVAADRYTFPAMKSACVEC